MTSKREYSIRSVDSIIQKVDKWGLAIMAQSLLSIIWLLLIPKEPANAVILGYSLRRLALLFPMTLPFIFGFVLYFSAKKEAGWMTKLLSSKNLAATASFIIIGGAVFALGSWSLIFMPIFLRIITDLGLIYRTIPLLTSIFLLGMEAMIFVPLVIFPGKSPSNPEKKRFPIVTFLITLGVLLAIFILIEITGLGKDPERVSIISLGVPILESQIWYIVGLMALLIISVYSWHSLPANDHPQLRKHGDLIIASVLWLIAVVIWMSLPLPSNNYFAPEVQPPNFEKYPFSDAEQYDFNSLYVYYGSLENFVVSKPLYVSFLAILHAIGGLSYANIIFMQTLVVALFPPVLYLVGRELHSRLGGIAIALFAIFREVSNIQASSIATTSNTKLLLSDMPAALLAAILALTIIRWFKLKEKRISGHEFLIGGLIGLLILTRIQTMALVP
ncbi:MAG: hypothetical protein FJZ98_09865, partial [Chloroflexi bacterium]|nr:hypothetical protein [Chloroflexota bacterium]